MKDKSATQISCIFFFDNILQFKVVLKFHMKRIVFSKNSLNINKQNFIYMVLDLNSKSTLGPKVIVQIIKALACMQQEVTSNYMFQHMRSVGFHVSGSVQYAKELALLISSRVDFASLRMHNSCIFFSLLSFFLFLISYKGEFHLLKLCIIIITKLEN